MATVTVYTAERMKAIEDKAIIDGGVVINDLILTRYDGTTINAGNVRGPVGPQGPVDPNGVNLDQVQTITGVKTFSTPPSATALAISGLSGAALASRYVGATAGGKPTTGTFDVGDYIIDRAGYIWICTVAGTPGTWVSPARGILGFARVTANQNFATVDTDLTGMSVNVVVGTNRHIRLTTRAYISTSVASDSIVMYMKEGTTQLQIFDVSLPLAFRGDSRDFSVRITPTPGAHTYKLSGFRNNGSGGGVFNASTTSPAELLVEDIGGV